MDVPNHVIYEGVYVMLLRDAQEEARIVYTARRYSAKGGEDLLLLQMAEAADIIKELRDMKMTDWEHTHTSKTRIVGLLLLIAFGLANKMKVDSLEAFKSVLLEESP